MSVDGLTAVVLGAGTMGHGIAQVLAQGGLTVRLRDMEQGFVDAGLSKIAKNLDGAVSGVNTHPGYAKQKMVNSIRLMAKYLDRLPAQGMSPESTTGREGFMHPYVLEGGVHESKARILLRDFETAKLARQARILNEIADGLRCQHPEAKIDVKIDKQYRNMGQGLRLALCRSSTGYSCDGRSRSRRRHDKPVCHIRPGARSPRPGRSTNERSHTFEYPAI